MTPALRPTSYSFEDLFLAQVQAQNALLTAALTYGAHGMFVFPTHDVSQGKCSCGKACNSPGKHPRTVHGFKEATTNPVTIAQWWQTWPQANIGIDCGRSGLFVVDVDTKKGAQGEATLRWFVERHPEFGQTLLVGTPTGGKHYYFRGTGAGRDLGPGINVRSEGGYVLAPPSRAFSSYDADGAPVPGSARGYYVERQAPIAAMPPGLAPLVTPQTDDTLYIPAPGELEGERESIPYGSHRTSLLWLTWHLRAVQGLSVEAALPIARAFMESGVLEGYNPRHPFSDNELRKYLRDVRANVSTAPPPAQVRALADSLLSGREVVSTKPPLRQHFITGLILQGELHVFYGEPGVGKSTICAYELACISRQGLDVLVFINEDTHRDFALSYHYAGGDLDRLTFQNSDVREMLLPKDNGELESIIASRQWGAIYFDSIGDMNAADPRKHAGDQARAIYKPLGNLARRYNVSIICTAHTNKAGVLEGAKQIEAKARVIARISRPPKVSVAADGETMNIVDIAHDPVWTAHIETEKFSRGPKGTRYAVHFETIQSHDPYTGEVDMEINESGVLTPVMQYVAKWHEKLPPADPESASQPSKTKRKDEVREKIIELHKEHPEWNYEQLRKAAGCRTTTVVEIIRELRPDSPP